MSSPDNSPGILGSLRALGDDLLASLQDRVELVSLELQEEKYRLIQTFLRIGVLLFTFGMALTFASLTVVYLCWEKARLGILAGLTLLYIAATVAVVLSFRRYLARQPRPLASTIEELEKDRACIPKGH